MILRIDDVIASRKNAPPVAPNDALMNGPHGMAGEM